MMLTSERLGALWSRATVEAIGLPHALTRDTFALLVADDVLRYLEDRLERDREGTLTPNAQVLLDHIEERTRGLRLDLQRRRTEG